MQPRTALFCTVSRSVALYHIMLCCIVWVNTFFEARNTTRTHAHTLALARAHTPVHTPVSAAARGVAPRHLRRKTRPEQTMAKIFTTTPQPQQTQAPHPQNPVGSLALGSELRHVKDKSLPQIFRTTYPTTNTPAPYPQTPAGSLALGSAPRHVGDTEE